jgi:shikimate kinase
VRISRRSASAWTFGLERRQVLQQRVGVHARERRVESPSATSCARSDPSAEIDAISSACFAGSDGTPQPTRTKSAQARAVARTQSFVHAGADRYASGEGRYGALVAVVLVTGMSGTGKSTALAELARRGYRVVDTDHGGYAEEIASSHGTWEQRWREDRIEELLDEHDDGVLFIAGCVPNQRAFYPRFDAIVLLSAPVDVILGRVATRQTNDFGKSDEERDRILGDHAAFEPLLRAGSTDEIDTRAPLAHVVDALERIAMNAEVRPA